ncbi:hypothetical protein [Adhaeribacter pallidiroseus]|nr:hypothetical protein [Adhaeribacter pallidiroseus]
MEYNITAGTAFPAPIGKRAELKTLGDISDFTGAPQRVKTLAERDALPYELRKWNITTCFVEDNSIAGDGSGEGEWFRLTRVIAGDIMHPLNWRSESESSESILTSLPYFQVDSTVEVDAAYVKGQTVKHVVEEGGPIRLFEALLAFPGTNNPAPTGLETNTNWKEVSPSALTGTAPVTIPYNQEGGSGPFRHKQGDVIRQWDGSGTNNSRLYVRTGKAYPLGEKISPVKDFYEEYWEALGEYGVTPQKTLYWFTDASKAGTFLPPGSPVYTPGQVMPIVTTAPQEFPGRAVLNIERCDHSKPAQMPCIGLVERGIDPGKVGRVISQGILTTGLGSWPVGTKLYVGVNGGLTDLKPVSPNVVQQVAIVLGKAATSCMILVDVKAPEIVASGAAAPVATPIEPSPFIIDYGSTIIADIKQTGTAAMQALGTTAQALGTASLFTSYQDYFGRYTRYVSAASAWSLAGNASNGVIIPNFTRVKGAISFAMSDQLSVLGSRLFVGITNGTHPILNGANYANAVMGIAYDNFGNGDGGFMIWMQFYTGALGSGVPDWKVYIPLLDQDGVHIVPEPYTSYEMTIDYHGEKPDGERALELHFTATKNLYPYASPDYAQFSIRKAVYKIDNYITRSTYSAGRHLGYIQAYNATGAAVAKDILIRRLVSAHSHTHRNLANL